MMPLHSEIVSEERKYNLEDVIYFRCKSEKEMEEIKRIYEWWYSPITASKVLNLELKEIKYRTNCRINLACKILQIRKLSEYVGVITVTDGTRCPHFYLCITHHNFAEFVAVDDDSHSVDIVATPLSPSFDALKVGMFVTLLDIEVKAISIPGTKGMACQAFKRSGKDPLFKILPTIHYRRKRIIRNLEKVPGGNDVKFEGKLGLLSQSVSFSLDDLKERSLEKSESVFPSTLTQISVPGSPKALNNFSGHRVESDCERDDTWTAKNNEKVLIHNQTTEFQGAHELPILKNIKDIQQNASPVIVTAWMTCTFPSISGPPENLVVSICEQCTYRKRGKCRILPSFETKMVCPICTLKGYPALLFVSFSFILQLMDRSGNTMDARISGKRAEDIFGCTAEFFLKNKISKDRVKSLLRSLESKAAAKDPKGLCNFTIGVPVMWPKVKETSVLNISAV